MPGRLGEDDAMTAWHDYMFWMSMLRPSEAVAILVLAGIMLVTERDDVELKDVWYITIGAAIPLFLWACLCRGIDASDLVRYTGIFVIWGVTLVVQDNFSRVGAFLCAGVLTALTAGGHEFDKGVGRSATGAAVEAAKPSR